MSSPFSSAPDLLDAIDWYRRCLEDIQDGRPVTGLREAKLSYDKAVESLRSLVTESEAAMRETQTRAMNMSEMRLSAFQRQTLANVVEPLSCVLAGKPHDGLIDGR